MSKRGPHADPLLPQTENGVLLPSLQSALPFLDLHGTPRLEFHQSVFDELRDKLLERVSAIALEGKAEERWAGRWRVQSPPRLGADVAVLTVPLAPHPHPKRGPVRPACGDLSFSRLLSGDGRAATSDWVPCSFLSPPNLSRYKKLEDLLEKSFSLVKMPSLQPVVMCVMKHLPKVRAVAWCTQGTRAQALTWSRRQLGSGEVS